MLDQDPQEASDRHNVMDQNGSPLFRLSELKKMKDEDMMPGKPRRKVDLAKTKAGTLSFKEKDAEAIVNASKANVEVKDQERKVD